MVAKLGCSEPCVVSCGQSDVEDDESQVVEFPASQYSSGNLSTTFLPYTTAKVDLVRSSLQGKQGPENHPTVLSDDSARVLSL